MRSWITAALLLALGLSLAGCGNDHAGAAASRWDGEQALHQQSAARGPLEDRTEEGDALEQAGEDLKDAGDTAKQAAKDAGDAVKRAAKDAGQAAKDAGEDVKNSAESIGKSAQDALEDAADDAKDAADRAGK